MPRSARLSLEAMGFSLVKIPETKQYNAYCKVCEKNLCNTASKRLMAHRHKCLMPGLDIGNIKFDDPPNPTKKREESLIDYSANEDNTFASMYVPENGKSKEDSDLNMQVLDVEGATHDECIAFGKYVSTQLRKMDSRTCAMVKYKISETLYNAEMGNFAEK